MQKMFVTTLKAWEKYKPSSSVPRQQMFQTLSKRLQVMLIKNEETNCICR